MHSWDTKATMNVKLKENPENTPKGFISYKRVVSLT